ncbi:MAG TPA: serine protease, partial [Pirellulales bacterium]|nr:serine protease [Pirellulales bacterium]
IEVVLGQQTWPADVVAFDKEHDLAILHVAAANLPTLSLANSEAVELAEEMRAVGYPLSDLLGESVKVTRCSIGGILNASGRKVFHVDGSVNPGNSGGPLVNEMGQVVGVTSSKLAREDIDGVGFAVPTGEVLTLLETKRIRLSPAAKGQKLDGPALAKRVTPSVALIKVIFGPGGYNTARHFVLDFSGRMITTAPKSQVILGARLAPPNDDESETAKLLVTERGEVLGRTGKLQLPYLFGHLCTLVVEPLGEPGQRSWKTERIILIAQPTGQQSQSPFLGFGCRGRADFGGFPFGPSQPQMMHTMATETRSYELTKEDGNLVSIKKKYDVETVATSGSAPSVKLTGEGVLTFNRAQGFPEKLEYKVTLVRGANNATTTTPLSIEWRRLPQAELDELRAGSPASLQAATDGKSEAGDETAFVGGPRGKPQRIVNENSIVYGFDCDFGYWNGTRAVSQLVPLYSRTETRRLPAGEMARDGYALGAVNVNPGDYVLGVQLVFMRMRDDGQLDSNDSYTGEWIGAPPKGKMQTASGNGSPVIGVHLRRGAVIDAFALVLKRKKPVEAQDKSAAGQDLK